MPAQRREKECPLIAHIPQGEGQFSEGAHVHSRVKAEGWHLFEARDYITDGGDGSVFITAVIDTHNGRDIACFDIPGADQHKKLDGS